MTGVSVIPTAALPWSAIAHELVGSDHGLGITLVLVDAPPGRGPRLHTHPYDEVLIVIEGRARLLGEEEEREAVAGDVVIVPAGVPHGFVNSGAGPLRQVDIHVSPGFATEWLDTDAQA
jgi:quercetin dioxygenase-like cupin family protein